MRFNKIKKHLFKNQNDEAKRKNWVNKSIMIKEIGWANPMNIYWDKSNNIKDYYLINIENNVYRDKFTPSLIDILSNDWEIIKNKN